MERHRFRVNGLEIDAQFRRADRQRIFLPLLRRLTQLQARKGSRLIVFLAAPPAAGKSTLCCYLEYLSRVEVGLTPVQCIGMDGFHYPQAYLNSHSAHLSGKEIPLSRIKGAPESFDVSALKQKLDQARQGDPLFPVYDRRIHDVLPNALAATEKILLFEGNYLLLDEGAWRDLECDYSIFLRCGDESLLERIVQRKMLGGYSEAEARRMARENDWPNICRCMAHSRRADLNLRYNQEGALEEI